MNIRLRLKLQNRIKDKENTYAYTGSRYKLETSVRNTLKGLVMCNMIGGDEIIGENANGG